MQPMTGSLQRWWKTGSSEESAALGKDDPVVVLEEVPIPDYKEEGSSSVPFSGLDSEFPCLARQ